MDDAPAVKPWGKFYKDQLHPASPLAGWTPTTPLSRSSSRSERAARQPRYWHSPPADAPDDDYDDDGRP